MIPILSKQIRLQGAANSERGGRPENQDDWLSLDTPLGFLLVVCDGMGGGPGGKTASGLVKQAVAACFSSANATATPEETMKQAVAKAEEALEQRMREEPSLRGMGSTLVALLVSKDRATIAHLGDSRCYQMRGNKMVFRTKDHSLVGELVQYKTLTEEQARTSPQSNVITRALGSTANHVADIDTVAYRRGDRFILCTDGVWGIMPQEQLISRFAAPDAPKMVENLSKEIDNIGFSTDGHHDNHTLAVVDMGENSNFQGNMTKNAKIIIAVLAGLLFVSLVVNMLALSKGNVAEGPRIFSHYQKQNTSLEDSLYNYFVEYESLLEVTDSLNKVIMKKDQELASALSVIADPAGQKPAKPVATPADAQKQDIAEADASLFDEDTPRGIASAVIYRLTQMRDATSDESARHLTAQKHFYRKKAQSLLDKLDTATGKKHKEAVKKIKAAITDDVKEQKGKKTVTEATAMNVDSKRHSDDNRFHSTDKAVTKLNELIADMEAIAKQL